MTEREGTGASPDWARRAATRAATRGGYMAGLLATYQEMHTMDERALAEELNCPIERLPLLGLCREPGRDATRFAADVRKLADFANASPFRLASLIRTVNTMRALAEEGNIAAAARDREETEDREDT